MAEPSLLLGRTRVRLSLSPLLGRFSLVAVRGRRRRGPVRAAPWLRGRLLAVLLPAGCCSVPLAPAVGQPRSAFAEAGSGGALSCVRPVAVGVQRLRPGHGGGLRRFAHPSALGVVVPGGELALFVPKRGAGAPGGHASFGSVGVFALAAGARGGVRTCFGVEVSVVGCVCFWQWSHGLVVRAEAGWHCTVRMAFPLVS